MTPVLRAFNATIDDVNKKDRTIVAKIGTGDLDRYATVIDPKGIDLRAYTANPVVLWEHGKDVRGSLPVGRNLWIRVDRSGNGRLIAKTQFRDDEFSRNLHECYEGGWLRGWSVSILPNEYGAPTPEQIRARPELKNCEIYYNRSELCEYSATAVPGNASALSDDELRSLSNVISRGIPVPADVQEAIDRMSSVGGMAGGGALIKPETADDDKGNGSADDLAKDAADDADKGAKDGVKAKKKRDADCDDDMDDDDDDDDKDKEDRTLIQLPDFHGRTFEQVFYTLLNEERQYRDAVLKRMQEQIDWYFGKV